MGIKARISEIITSLIINYLLISTCCDIRLINCDIHQMRQSAVAADDTNNSSPSEMDNSSSSFKINATELEEHIMNGLNMKQKPDIDMVRTTHFNY